MDNTQKYAAIDLKSFYASVECILRKLDPLNTNLVVADESRTEKTICLAVSPALRSYNNIYEHFDNLKMIASITTKIAILELVLRNLLDKHMKEKDLEWLRNYNEENIKQKIIKL